MPTGSRDRAGSIQQGVLAELRAEQARRQLSQAELAKLTGIPASTLSRVLRGHRDNSFDTIVTICDALGLRLSQILEATPEGIDVSSWRRLSHADRDMIREALADD